MPEAPRLGRRRFSQRAITRSRSPERLVALGRRAAEGVPDSRAEAKGLGSAKRGERPVRGRRHLVVISQVMRRNSQKRESAASS